MEANTSSNTPNVLTMREKLDPSYQRSQIELASKLLKDELGQFDAVGEMGADPEEAKEAFGRILEFSPGTFQPSPISSDYFDNSKQRKDGWVLKATFKPDNDIVESEVTFTAIAPKGGNDESKHRFKYEMAVDGLELPATNGITLLGYDLGNSLKKGADKKWIVFRDSGVSTEND